MKERPDYLPERLREQLIHDPRVAEQDLKVEVHESRVVLGGNVATPEIRDIIAQVAHELAPQFEIVNETVVVPCAEPETEEPVA